MAAAKKKRKNKEGSRPDTPTGADDRDRPSPENVSVPRLPGCVVIHTGDGWGPHPAAANGTRRHGLGPGPLAKPFLTPECAVWIS